MVERWLPKPKVAGSTPVARLVIEVAMQGEATQPDAASKAVTIEARLPGSAYARSLVL